MNTKIFFITVLSFFFVADVYGQEPYQTFSTARFKVKCGCKLYVNSTFIQMAKQQGANNIIAAYICAENQDDPDTGVIYNVNILNESNGYKDIQPPNYSLFEKDFLQQYANNLANSGISYRYRYSTFQGITSLEYTFDQQGIPTKAVLFLKNKKSYFLQAGTRTNLTTKFNLIKSSFVIL